MPEALARSDHDFRISGEEEEPPRWLALWHGALHTLLTRPVETLGCLAMAGFATAIVSNALVMQNRTHPAPLFTRQSVAALPSADPAPPRVQVAQRTGAAPAGQGDQTASLPAVDSVVLAVQTELARLGGYDGTPDGLTGKRTEAAIRAFQSGAGLPVDGQASPGLLAALRRSRSPADPDPIARLIHADAAAAPAAPDRRVLGVERALALLGYGPLKVDGLADGQTRGAIERFERDRALPLDGAVTPRLSRELAAVSGMPVP